MDILIVDDEELARRALILELRGRPQVGSIVQASDARAAFNQINISEFDVIFLDIQLPEMNGFGLIARLGLKQMPPVIFVTAHEAFALPAFEVQALDYLLKPFSSARFDEAFRRAVRATKLSRDTSGSGGGDELHLEDSKGRTPNQLQIKSAGLTRMLSLEDVHWVEASGSYVRIHADEQVHLLRSSMAAIEERFDSSKFVRVHRSAIVRIASIAEMRHVVRGDYELLLVNGDRVRVSRRRRSEFFERLKGRTLP